MALWRKVYVAVRPTRGVYVPCFLLPMPEAVLYATLAGRTLPRLDKPWNLTSVTSDSGRDSDILQR